MRRRKQGYIRGTSSHRRTEDSYLGALLDAVTLDDWKDVVTSTVEAAKSGDTGARAWLGQYLIGRPGSTAPSPMTVIVQQLSGTDPVVERLAKPHIERARYPSLHDDDDLIDDLKAEVAAELDAMQIDAAGDSQVRAEPQESRRAEGETQKNGTEFGQLISAK